MEDILECPQCSSRNINLVPDEEAKFIYKCKNCNYTGTKIVKLDKLDEERRKLMSMTLSKNTKKEIDQAIRRRKEIKR